MQTSGIEQLYSKIANQLNSVIPVSWNQVYLHAEIDEYSNESYFYFQPENGKGYIYGLDIPTKYNVEKEEFIDIFIFNQ